MHVSKEFAASVIGVDNQFSSSLTENTQHELQNKFHAVYNIVTVCSGETKWCTLDEISGPSNHAAYINIIDHYGLCPCSNVVRKRLRAAILLCGIWAMSEKLHTSTHCRGLDNIIASGIHFKSDI